MKYPIGVALIVCILFTQPGWSQPVCGFDALHNRSLNTDATYRRLAQENESHLQQIITEQKARRQRPSARLSDANAPLYVIPVVVHVLHTGGAEGTAYNPSTARITAAIDYLNQVYNGTLPGIEGVGDVQIQFVLATRDPNCNATNGINRVDASGIPNYTDHGINADAVDGVPEPDLKNFVRWDPYNYYNIYVVNKIDSKDGLSPGQFIAGYARFPLGPPELDGTVMLASQMDAGQKTLPHEIGHALALYHPFQGSNDAAICPVNTDCSAQGDYVCDTDPISLNATGGIIDFSCRTGVNTCAAGSPNYSINTEHNFMSYTNCSTLFTVGQKDRMLAAMTVAGRRELATSWASVNTYPLSFTAPGGASCAPATSALGLSDTYAGVMSVSLANKIFSSGTSSEDDGYNDQTNSCLGLISLYTTGTYSINTALWGANYEQVNAWIDYNNNGIFEPGERILRDDTIAPAIHSATETFTVPGSAVTNQVLRMRVVEEVSSLYGLGYLINDACYNPVYGQAEDYPVIILPSILPATWAYFRGVQEPHAIRLLWKTNTEVNTSYFDIERSYDGSHFTKIGEVEASGIATGAFYSYNDKTYSGPVVYYRLKQVDLLGQATYTNTIIINSETNNHITVRNNPFRTSLELDISASAPSKLVIHLLDATGKLVHQQTTTVSGNDVLRVTPGNGKLSAGLYIIKATLNGKTVTRKVIKE